MDPILEQLLRGIGGQEADPNNVYGGRNRTGSGALGKYQVMPDSLREWSREIVGREVSQDEFLTNPQLQEQIARGKLGQYYNQYLQQSGGDPILAARKAATAWYSGPGNADKHADYQTQFPQGGTTYPSRGAYVDSVLNRAGLGDYNAQWRQQHNAGVDITGDMRGRGSQFQYDTSRGKIGQQLSQIGDVFSTLGSMGLMGGETTTQTGLMPTFSDADTILRQRGYPGAQAYIEARTQGIKELEQMFEESDRRLNALLEGGVDAIPTSGISSLMRPVNSVEEARAAAANGFIPVRGSLADKITQAAAATVEANNRAANDIVALRSAEQTRSGTQAAGLGLGQAIANMFGGQGVNLNVGGALAGYENARMNALAGREAAKQVRAEGERLNSRAQIDAALEEMSAAQPFVEQALRERQEQFLQYQQQVESARLERLRNQGSLTLEKMSGQPQQILSALIGPFQTGNKLYTQQTKSGISGSDARGMFGDAVGLVRDVNEGSGYAQQVQSLGKSIAETMIEMQNAENPEQVRNALDAIRNVYVPEARRLLQEHEAWRNDAGSRDFMNQFNTLLRQFNTVEDEDGNILFSTPIWNQIYQGDAGWSQNPNFLGRTMNNIMNVIPGIANVGPNSNQLLRNYTQFQDIVPSLRYPLGDPLYDPTDISGIETESVNPYLNRRLSPTQGNPVRSLGGTTGMVGLGNL